MHKKVSPAVILSSLGPVKIPPCLLKIRRSRRDEIAPVEKVSHPLLLLACVKIAYSNDFYDKN